MGTPQCLGKKDTLRPSNIETYQKTSQQVHIKVFVVYRAVGNGLARAPLLLRATSAEPNGSICQDEDQICRCWSTQRVKRPL